MPQRTVLATAILAVLLSAAFAGCFDDGGINAGTTAGDDSADEPGSVQGTVTDDELRPVADVRVLLADAETTSDGSGHFEIHAIPAGAHTLRAEHPRFVPHASEIVIEAGRVVARDVRLSPLPTTEPHQVTTPFDGKYECTWEFLVIGGDCLVLYEEFTGEPDPLTNDTYAFRLPILDTWESVVMELAWQSDGTNQFDGMRLYLEHGNGSKTGHATTVGRADGDANPLSFVVHRGVPHPGAETYDGTDQKAQIPDEGEVAQVRVFPHGKFYETTSMICTDDGCLLGVGAGVDVRFTVYGTVFYHARAPGGFSAVPSG